MRIYIISLASWQSTENQRKLKTFVLHALFWDSFPWSNVKSLFHLLSIASCGTFAEVPIWINPEQTPVKIKPSRLKLAPPPKKSKHMEATLGWTGADVTQPGAAQRLPVFISAWALAAWLTCTSFNYLSSAGAINAVTSILNEWLTPVEQRFFAGSLRPSCPVRRSLWSWETSAASLRRGGRHFVSSVGWRGKFLTVGS